ncbi:MAG: hypothetical protein IT585_09340 [candidate division Zixibacteria bacterium]|nr:hypothetical protein [candidate division Zixibacteria bacterium]
MVATDMKRGFPKQRFEKSVEPRVKCDEGGYFIYTLSENVKVYFDDYYGFLERAEQRALADIGDIKAKEAELKPHETELRSYLCARKKILETLLRTVYDFYTEANNFGVVMTPWCFGTVVLEKVEAYRDKLAKGNVEDSDLPEYTYDVVRYIEEIYRKTLLDTFDFPEKAFSMRWQYSELLKRYSKALTNISASLQSVMMLVKSYGS